MHPLRLLPLWAFLPLRWAVARLRRRNPLRMAAIVLLRQARQATTGTLAGRLSSVVPLDRPDLLFEPVDSMIMDAVFWMGLAGMKARLPTSGSNCAATPARCWRSGAMSACSP